MSERSDEIPEREGFISVALALAFQLARAPPARCKGCATEVSKSLPEKTLDRIMDQILVNWSSFYRCILQ